MYRELKDVWRELTGPGGQFEISEVEVRGELLRTYKNAPATLRDFWLMTAGYGDNDYLVYDSDRISYSEAHRQVAQVANWLMAQGVQPGDRVAISMRNYPEWMLAYWACVSIGVACVGMNAWWVGPEIVYGIADSQPKVIIADQERLDRMAEAREHLDETILVAVRTPNPPAEAVPWTELTRGAADLPHVAIDPDDDASIFYTSGTTGRPKGAQLTHRGCVSNVMSIAFSATVQALASARASVAAPEAADPGVADGLAALVTTPLFHVTANNCVAQATTLAGGKLVHMYKWDAGEALRLIEAERITGMTGVPVMARELISHPDFATRDTSSLSSLGGGGAQVQPDLVHRIEQEVASARPTTGYGMTETCGIITALSADFFVDRADSAGPAMPCFEAKCVDDDGEEVPVGQTGELWVKGAQVIKGYLNQAEASAEAITGGWLHTGDIARMDDDAFIYIVDRAKDMVLRGGENVYSAEVEGAIFEHGSVAECAVFGVPDQRLGEEVGAAVVLNDGSALGAEALREHLRERISSFKVPRYIWFPNERLPRNASGKFLKRQLRDTLDPTDAE
ncbi:MAG: class I adenylate-forming enzyme family protein [Acidimicrobiales bacterium]